ncbi:MAG: hypothetical protein V1766_14580 [Pseudomonadota bacterium]
MALCDIDVQDAYQFASRHHRHGNGRTDIAARIDWRKTRIINLSIYYHGLLVTGYPAGNTTPHGHTLPDVLTVPASGNGNIKLLAVTSRKHYGHLVRSALLKDGICNFIHNGVQIGGKSDRFTKFMNGYGLFKLYVIHPQTAYFHGS